MHSSCAHVTIPNQELCTVAGVMSAGAICAESQTDKTRDMTLDEWITFLEPTADHAGAICQSAKGFSEIKTALEQACRILGKRCTLELRQAVKTIDRVLRVRKVEGGQ